MSGEIRRLIEMNLSDHIYTPSGGKQDGSRDSYGQMHITDAIKISIGYVIASLAEVIAANRLIPIMKLDTAKTMEIINVCETCSLGLKLVSVIGSNGLEIPYTNTTSNADTWDGFELSNKIVNYCCNNLETTLNVGIIGECQLLVSGNLKLIDGGHIIVNCTPKLEEEDFDSVPYNKYAALIVHHALFVLLNRDGTNEFGRQKAMEHRLMFTEQVRRIRGTKQNNQEDNALGII